MKLGYGHLLSHPLKVIYLLSFRHSVWFR